MIEEGCIHQGDQYPLPITLTCGGDLVTPENMDAVRIIIGNIVDEWPNKTLYFQDDQWYFPLKQKDTLAFPVGRIEIQAQYMRDDDIVGSCTGSLMVKKSRFDDEWESGSNE